MEVEDHLRHWEKIEEVSVFCAPDDLIGNRIIAVVRPRPGEVGSTLALKRYCAEALPKYAIPHWVCITNEELPKGSTGKVDKRLVALRYGGGRPPADEATGEGGGNHGCA
jgi:long-chain acyl-CoA synthetase